ncbi:MAG: hypothetical protein R2862_12280 [Thermoanaerobaculia bacterium]
MLRAPWDYLLFSSVACLAALLGLRLLVRWRHRILKSTMVTVVLVVGWFYVEAAGHRRADEIERLVSAMAPTYAQEVELLGHADLPLRVAPDDPRYLAIIEAEKRWLAVNPEIADIYTFRRLADGTVVLFVDSETDYDRDGRISGPREQRTPIGEVYSNPVPAIVEAFAGKPSFDDRETTDRWGTWISSFVPMRDRNGSGRGGAGRRFRRGEPQPRRRARPAQRARGPGGGAFGDDDRLRDGRGACGGRRRIRSAEMPSSRRRAMPLSWRARRSRASSPTSATSCGRRCTSSWG